jgi:hypothetical protein
MDTSTAILVFVIVPLINLLSAFLAVKVYEKRQNEKRD